MSLALVLNPQGPMVDMAVRNFADSMRKVIATSDDYRSLEKEYPGISEALVKAMADTAKADVISDLPALRQRYAHLYATLFTPEETAELIGFYSSKAGQRLVLAKYAKLDATSLVTTFVEKPDASVSQRHIRDMNRSVTGAVLTEMSAEDRGALLEFAKRPVFQKLASARSAMEQLEADIANEPDPELDKALEAAINSVFLKFTGEMRSAK